MAKEQAERRKMAQLMFDLGQRAYGKGKGWVKITGQIRSDC